jgi:hypothetical protein
MAGSMKKTKHYLIIFIIFFCPLFSGQSDVKPEVEVVQNSQLQKLVGGFVFHFAEHIGDYKQSNTQLSPIEEKSIKSTSYGWAEIMLAVEGMEIDSDIIYLEDVNNDVDVTIITYKVNGEIKLTVVQTVTFFILIVEDNSVDLEERDPVVLVEKSRVLLRLILAKQYRRYNTAFEQMVLKNVAEKVSSIVHDRAKFQSAEKKDNYFLVGKTNHWDEPFVDLKLTEDERDGNDSKIMPYFCWYDQINFLYYKNKFIYYFPKDIEYSPRGRGRNVNLDKKWFDED